MEDNLNNKSSGNRRPQSSPMSAEEKLKKTMKGLSHTGGGGAGGLGLGSTSKSSTSSSSSYTNNAPRKKVGGVVLDLDTIQDATKQKFETKGRRKNVVILVLSLLLVVSIVYLIIAILGYNQSKKQTNFKYFIQGDAGASWIIEGGDKTAFLIRQGLGTDTIYLLDSKIKTNTTDKVTIELEVKVLLNGENILIAGLQDDNPSLVRVSNTNCWIIQEIQGDVIHMFSGLDFSEVTPELNSNNVVIEVTATVNII